VYTQLCFNILTKWKKCPTRATLLRERDKDKFFFEDRTTLTYTHTNYFLLCPMQLYYLIDRILLMDRDHTRS